MKPHARRIVHFLSQPASYPHPVQDIIHRETHVSHVFLAGSFAYKLKKPVIFPFLDASSLARRRKFCKLEITLNRRLSPAIYKDVVPVFDTPRGLRLGKHSGDGGRIVEYLVRMHRLPDDRMLDRLVAHRTIHRGEVVAITRRLAAFFKRAERSVKIDAYGGPQRIAQLLLGNLRECGSFVGSLLMEQERDILEASYRQALALYEPLFQRRVREGRIIDGHGDLRCENICVTRPVNIFDCVEFQPAFRCSDMANDISFLIMDLEFRARRDLAQVVEAVYRRGMKDATAGIVLPIYKCHRSLVRGKVRGFAWKQHPRTAEGRRLRALSRKHFQLALTYAREFAPPRLVVIGGLIGTGKSTLAQYLSHVLGATWLRTDEIRLREFSHNRRAPSGFAEGIYAPHISQLVYHRLIQRAENIIRRGGTVICDGTFSQTAGREILRAIAQKYQASFHFLECVVEKSVAMQRLARRYARGKDLSEARPEHYERLRDGFEPVEEWPSHEWTRLKTDGSANQTSGMALAALRRAWLPDGGR